MTRKLITWVSLLVALAAVASASPATPASAKIDATACTAQLRAQQAVRHATAGAVRTRRPVAMVPGLKFDPGTMIPRGICRAGPDAWGI